MGRIAADIDDEAVEHVYVPGTEHLWRLVVAGDTLELEPWRPRYRAANDRWGLSWDACISDGACWVMDCGDIESVRRIHTTEPNGRFAEPPGAALSWRRPAPWPGAQRLQEQSAEALSPAWCEETHGHLQVVIGYASRIYTSPYP